LRVSQAWVPSASRQWMAAQKAALPRINTDLLILTPICGKIVYMCMGMQV